MSVAEDVGKGVFRVLGTVLVTLTVFAVSAVFAPILAWLGGWMAWWVLDYWNGIEVVFGMPVRQFGAIWSYIGLGTIIAVGGGIVVGLKLDV